MSPDRKTAILKGGTRVALGLAVFGGVHYFTSPGPETSYFLLGAVGNFASSSSNWRDRIGIALWFAGGFGTVSAIDENPSTNPVTGPLSFITGEIVFEGARKLSRIGRLRFFKGNNQALR